MKYILFQIPECDQIYGEVLNITEPLVKLPAHFVEYYTYFIVKVKKTHIKHVPMDYIKPMDHIKMNREEYFEIYVNRSEIIREVSDEEYLTAMILES